VFPLLCPVHEADWIPGWEPRLVVSRSGVAEADCVFVTPAAPGEAIWYVTRHEPQPGFVEMIRITPAVTACRLTIRLRPTADGCEADVTYTHTSLGPQGDEFVASFTKEFFRRSCRSGRRGSITTSATAAPWRRRRTERKARKASRGPSQRVERSRRPAAVSAATKPFGTKSSRGHRLARVRCRRVAALISRE
jgi:hypothetical protein